MTSENMGDEVYQPTGGNEEQEDAAPLDLQDAVDEPDYDDLLDEGYSPPEKPLGVDKPGTTAEEQQQGESLDSRLAEEVPDVTDGLNEELDAADRIGDLPGGEGEPVDPEAGGERAGRLVAPDGGLHQDREKDLLATDVGIDAGAAGAEEAAVHVRDDGEQPAGPAVRPNESGAADESGGAGVDGEAGEERDGRLDDLP
ncbi:DUF5709 domain-containing protein [Streptomyces sp. XM4193]|uniref:DUF5709 domain-containing protein n=1 Tax=Streptomyces sp. XM4193 TaxID=2929782 RepID=UPI001FF9CFB6|nr:DUF5709 domain-containing protein [Streptomyces sp. XM4193]MCK1797432.1 DUF5709 domain-containing protein [Streptomyces sp. XM4193]